jgi:tetratricopeptide (TPR) repeat protein
VASLELDGFRLLEPIAQGGLSTVWRARHTGGSPAAVKILRQFGTPDEADRFRNEIRAVAGMSHPGIVRVLDLGHAATEFVLPTGLKVRKGTPWLAMEYVGGGTITPDHVKDWDTLAFVARALLESLGHANARGVIHRDLKPQNLLLVDSRDARAGVKLTDFGIAWTRADSPETGPTGTLDYMAPEQIEVLARRYGPWTDLYGLGCLLYELATGHLPFRDEPNRPLAMAHLLSPVPPLVPRFPCPPAFGAWLERTLAKEPHERFRNAAEALEALFGEPPRRTVDVQRASSAGAGLRLFGLRDIPLVGREAERAKLHDTLDASLEGPTVVSLGGPEGVGRSRLLRWFAEETSELGVATTFQVRPVDAGSTVTAAIRAATEATGLGGDELREQLDWWAGEEVDAEVRRELVQVLEPPPERRVDGAARATGAARWLAAVARRHRIVWAVDDAPQCPEAVLVAELLLADPSRPPVSIVLSVSDNDPVLDDSPLARLLGSAESIRLQPLSREQRLVVLQRALALEAGFASRIDDETGGHLLTAIELLRDHVDRGWIVPGRGGLRLAPGREVVVPGDRLAPFVSRLERAVGGDDEAGVQLELAAALGEDVSLGAWEAVGGSRHTEIRRTLLNALLSARLAERTTTGFRFAHPMARNAVLRQARLHGRFKEAHRTCLLWAQVTGASAERVARHLVELEEWPQAVEPLLEATQTRLEQDGPGSAQALLRTLELAIERARLKPSDRRVVRAKVVEATLLADQGRAAAAIEVLDQLAPSLNGRDAHAEKWAADVVRGECLALTGQLDEAFELFRAVESEPQLEDGLRIRVRDALTRLALRLGRNREAAMWATRSEELLERHGMEGLRGLNLLRHAGIANRRDDLAQARELLARAEPLLERYGSLQQRAILANEKAALIHRTGSAEEAEPLFERAIELSRAAGYRPVWASINLAVCKLDRRRIDEAETIVQESGALELPTESGPVTAASLVLAVCHAQRGRWAAFDRSLDKAEVGLLAHAEPDNAALLERAALVVETQGQVSRGQRCRRLAEAQRQRMAGDR